jgi:peptidyl-prolyl cis-trans isomerase A (cyclophilin A)
MIRSFVIEPLEARIAPAVTVFNPLFDLTPGIGKTGATIDLGKTIDSVASYRTRIEFTTNFIPAGSTTPGVIVIELFDDKAPLSVQNFLGYFEGKAGTTYDGTFFHRIFDFATGSEPGIDIIQAGGFNVADIYTHLPTDPTVHNEFNPDDPEVQNIRGTLAMAKTAVSPNTGSSEWFINLNNNADLLNGINNGGFAVFGRIVSGLEIADAIGKSTKYNFSGDPRLGALTDVPVQNYTAGIPTTNQLIQIVDAKIVPAGTSSAAGYTFEQPVVTDADHPDVASDLVKATIDANNQLHLTYAKGKTGRAEISIKINQGLDSKTETFIVNLQPNLIADFSTDTLPSVFVPGDKGTVKVKLTNNLAALAKGAVNVKLFLSAATGGINEASVGVDVNDIEITAKGAANVNLASGKSVTVPVSYLIPDTLVAGQQYFLLAQITQPDGSTLVEKFTDDNTGVSFGNHTFSLAFGEVGGRSKVPLTIIQTNGEKLTFSLTGKGTGIVTKDGNLLDVSISGTTASSTFSVKTDRGVIGDLDDLSIQDTIGSVKLGNIQLHGNFAASAGAKSIVFGDLGDNSAGAVGRDKDFTIGAPATDSTQKVSIKVGKVRDYSLSSVLAISSLTAVDWLNDEADTQPDNLILSGGLGTLKIAGDFEANLTSASTAKVASISVGGTMHDATLKSFGAVGTLTFGALTGSTIQTLGDITSLTVGSISGTSIFAGLTEKPDASIDFVNAKTIGTLKVNGTFSDSTVAAARLNSVTVNAVDRDAGTEVGGIYADAIKSYLRKDSGKGKLANLDDTNLSDGLPTIADPDPVDPAHPNYQVALF